MSNPIQQAIEALALILPMAKGYAHQHPVGNNSAFCDQAEAALSALQSLQGVELPKPVAAQHRFRHPQKGTPDWSIWQPCSVMKRRAWEIDSQGYEVEYRSLYTADQLRTAVAAAMARGAVPDMYCTCGNEWQWNTDVGSWELVASFLPDEVPEATQPTQAEAPSRLSDAQIDGCIDRANRKFNGRRQGPSGQQMTSYDDWKHWLAREVESAALAIPPAPQQPEALAQQERDREDAERYRFIRDNPWRGSLEAVIQLHRNAIWDREIDAAIRAARSSEGGGK